MLDTLPTIAEIAIVITGFVGLAVAVRPSLLSTQGVHGIRLRMHIAQTLTLMFLCLLPGFINEVLDSSTAEPWPISNGVMALSLTGLTVWRLQAQVSAPDRSRYGPLIIAVVLSVPIIIGCVLNATGVIQQRGSAIFFAGILLTLLTSCGTFVLLLSAVTEEG